MKQVDSWYSRQRDEHVERPRVTEGMMCSRSQRWLNNRMQNTNSSLDVRLER